MKTHYFYCLVIIAIFGGIASIPTAVHGQTTLKRYVQAGGGVLRSSAGGTFLSGTFGETIVGRFSKGTQGFWTSLLLPTPVREEEPYAPTTLTATPNPLRSSTSISFSVPSESQVTVRITDALGRVVRTLSDERYGAGNFQLLWDAKNSDGSLSSSGMYQCEVSVRPANGSKQYINRTSIVLIK